MKNKDIVTFEKKLEKIPPEVLKEMMASGR